MDTDPSWGAFPGRSRSSVGWFLALGLVAFIALGVARTYFGVSATGHPAVGKTLRISDLIPVTAGVDPVAAGDLRGKAVLVNFWATWCGPCRMELPQIAQLSRELASREDCVLLAVAVDRGSPDEVRTAVESLLGELGLDLPVYADPTGATVQSFLSAGGDEGIPTTVLLDGQGQVQAVWVGYHPDLVEAVKRAIESLGSASS